MIAYIPAVGDVLERDGRRIAVERVDEAARKVHLILSFADRKGCGRFWKDKREFVNAVTPSQGVTPKNRHFRKYKKSREENPGIACDMV